VAISGQLVLLHHGTQGVSGPSRFDDFVIFAADGILSIFWHSPALEIGRKTQSPLAPMDIDSVRR
jgi:hypothetical protein